MSYILEYRSWKRISEAESSGEMIYTSPGDPYQYKIMDGQWWSTGPKLPEWTSLENNSKANEILDRRHPGVRTGSDTTVSQVTPPQPTKPKQTEPTSPSISVYTGKIKHNYSGEKAANIALLIQTMEKYGITNPYAQLAALSVIAKESNFIPKSEIMNYSKERLPEVWGVFSKTGSQVSKGQGKHSYNELATQYANDPEKLANFVYGQKPHGMRKNAYGNTEPGDGWKYRGRGFNQITFKSGYEKYGKEVGMDLVSNPDLLNDPKIAAEAAVKFFLNRFKQKGIDPNQFSDKESAINKFAHANTGWGKDPSYAISKTRERASDFSISSLA